MALVRTGGEVGQISGRIGAHVWSHNRYGSYVRQGTIPVTSTTEHALAAKARLTAASQAWQSLSAPRKLSWNAWAAQNPTLNRLGQSIILTGHAAYVGLYARLESIQIGHKDDPPIDPPPAPLTGLTVTADVGAGDVALVYTPTPMVVPENLYIEACVVTSQGINFIQNFIRLIGRSGAAEPSPFDIETIVEDRFGTLQVDQILHVIVAVCDTSTGLLSAPRRAKATVITT